MDRMIAATLSFIASLVPNNRRHQPHQPGRHRHDSATRPMLIGVPARGRAAGVNVMQNNTNM